MAIKGTDYEIELLKSAKEILMRFIDVNPGYLYKEGVVDSEKITTAAKAIADALHGAVKKVQF